MIDIKLKSNEQTTVKINPEFALDGVPTWTVVSGTSATVTAEADGKSATIKGVSGECGPATIQVKANAAAPEPPTEPPTDPETLKFSEHIVVDVTNVNPSSALRIGITEAQVQEQPEAAAAKAKATKTEKETKNKHVEHSGHFGR